MKAVVTEIQKKKHSFYVFTDDGKRYWLSWTHMQEYGELHEGDEIDVEPFREWLLLHQYPMALNDAVRLLAQRAYSSGEIMKKLMTRYMYDTADMVLYKLEKEHFIDDETFAKDWVRSRIHCQIGKKRIIFELKNKGISEELALEALEEVEDEDKNEAILTFAMKLIKRYEKETDRRKAIGKALAAMARRGFGFDESKYALQQAQKRMTDEETD